MKQSKFLQNLAKMSLEQQEYSLRGIPFHLATIEEWENLETVLTNLDFIQEKVFRGMAYGVINDYAFAAAQLAKAEHHQHIQRVLGEFARGFNQEFSNFQQNPELAVQQIFNNLYSYHGFDDEVGLRLQEFIDQKSYPHSAVWMRQLNTTPKTSVPRELLRTLPRDTPSVRALCISRDGARIISGGVDGRIAVRKWEDGSILASFDAHPEGIVAIAWYSDSPDENKIVSAGADQFVRIWDGTSGEKLREWDARAEAINSMAVLSSMGQVCTCSNDGIIRVWNLENGQEQLQLRGHVGRVLCLSTASGSPILVSGGEDLTVRAWHLGPKAKSERLYGHMDAIRSVFIDPGGKWVISAGDDRTVRILELGTNKPPVVLHGHTQTIRCLALAHDRNGVPLLISGSDDETIRVWNRQTGELIRVLRANQYGVNALACDPFGRYFASAGEDGAVIIWNADVTPIPDSWIEHEDQISSLVADQNRVVSASRDGTARIWDGESGAHCYNLRDHFGAVNDVAIMNDKIVSCGQDGGIRIHEIATGRFLQNLNWRLGQRVAGLMEGSSFLPAQASAEKGHTGAVNCLCPISPNALLSGGADGTVRLWNVEIGQEILKFTGAQGSIEMLIFSKKHLAVAGAGNGREIALWSTGAADVQVTYLVGHTSPVTALCLTQQEQLVSSSRDGTVRLWNIPTREEIGRFSGHDHWVLCVATWRDSIIAGGDDATIRVWDIRSGRPIHVLEGHTAPVRALMIDPLTERLYSYGEDRRLNVWSLRDSGLQASVYLSSVVTHLTLLDRQRLCAGTQHGGIVFLSLEINP